MSVFVGYARFNDFFYSGHVGACLIHALEFNAVGYTGWFIYSMITMTAQVFLMIALRSHYSVDMIAGAMFAHYMWVMTERYIYIIDWYCFGIPLHKRMLKFDPIKETESNLPSGGIGSYFISCKNCNHPMSNYMI